MASGPLDGRGRVIELMISRNGPASNLNSKTTQQFENDAGEFSLVLFAQRLSSQNFSCQHVTVCSLKRNDMHFFELDFISHPEGFNGEIDLGCWMLEEEED